MPPDLRTLDSSSFETLIFDHPAYEGQDLELDGNRIVRVLEERPTEWYWEVDWSWADVPSDPLHTLALITSLFESPEALPQRYTLRQISQGFGLLLGPAGADPFVCPLWNAALPWEPRERLLHAVVPLYDRLFDVETGIEHVPFMFWDTLLGYRYHNRALAIPRSDDDARVQEVVADVISEQLLELNGPWSAPSGLHGAHHAHHANGYRAVERWLGDPDNDDAHWTKYARQVLRGEVM